MGRKPPQAHCPASSLPEHGIYWHMRTRCENPRYEHYDRYGGRGIVVCDRWKKSFWSFFQDMGSRPTRLHTLDRIDNDGNYEPENCRWATRAEQLRNTSVNHRITYNGETLCVADWAERLSLSASAFVQRIRIHGVTALAFAPKQEPGGQSGIPRYTRKALGKSGYKGVYRAGNFWQAKIKHRGVGYYIGFYYTAKEAARAYDEAAIRLHGDYARLNFPQSSTEAA